MIPDISWPHIKFSIKTLSFFFNDLTDHIVEDILQISSFLTFNPNFSQRFHFTRSNIYITIIIYTNIQKWLFIYQMFINIFYFCTSAIISGNNR